jgi:hypothetical protein
MSLEAKMRMYYDTIKSNDLSELNWLIAVKKVEVKQAKNMYNLISVCFISAIFVAMPALITRGMDFNMAVVFVYLLFGCTAIFYGFKCYKDLVLKPIS